LAGFALLAALPWQSAFALGPGRPRHALWPDRTNFTFLAARSLRTGRTGRTGFTPFAFLTTLTGRTRRAILQRSDTIRNRALQICKRIFKPQEICRALSVDTA
jgi:hypothetical protein